MSHLPKRMLDFINKTIGCYEKDMLIFRRVKIVHKVSLNCTYEYENILANYPELLPKIATGTRYYDTLSRS